ncbi:MAG TPA: hypothetical protein VJM15_08880 [Sphingomicrobium sp.]|nr:hypothetical protein [Sphingomicrobium sp.]
MPESARSCDIHVYPADGVHSVGEDFDAVKRVDQDLRDYYRAAGRSLDWLTPDRQLTLISQLPIARLIGADNSPTTMHSEPLSRHQALEPGPRQPGAGCVVEVMLPQLMLERGGLAGRSLRVFGVVRRYDNGALTRSYSGFASSSMEGFRLKAPEDAPAATSLVEQAYRGAVETVLRNSTKIPRK